MRREHIGPGDPVDATASEDLAHERAMAARLRGRDGTRARRTGAAVGAGALALGLAAGAAWIVGGEASHPAPHSTPHAASQVGPEAARRAVPERPVGSEAPGPLASTAMPSPPSPSSSPPSSPLPASTSPPSAPSPSGPVPEAVAWPAASASPPPPPVPTSAPTSAPASPPERAALPQAPRSTIAAQVEPIPPAPPPPALAPSAPTPSAPAPSAPLRAEVPAPTHDEVAAYLAHSRDFIRTGNIAAARALLERAAEGEDSEALFALAETYDPQMLARWGTRGIRADAEAARRLYVRAAQRGQREASERLLALRR